MHASASALRLGKRTGTAILTGLLLWSAPPASAGRDWDDDDHRGHRHQRYDDDRHHGRRHHAARRLVRTASPPARRPATTGARHAGRAGWYAPRPVAHARYWCEPCGHWYDDEAAFHGHIHHHHNIAQAVIPLVIGAAAFGWIFYGY